MSSNQRGNISFKATKCNKTWKLNNIVEKILKLLTDFNFAVGKRCSIKIAKLIFREQL